MVDSGANWLVMSDETSVDLTVQVSKPAKNRLMGRDVSIDVLCGVETGTVTARSSLAKNLTSDWSMISTSRLRMSCVSFCPLSQRYVVECVVCQHFLTCTFAKFFDLFFDVSQKRV